MVSNNHLQDGIRNNCDENNGTAKTVFEVSYACMFPLNLFICAQLRILLPIKIQIIAWLSRALY